MHRSALATQNLGRGDGLIRVTPLRLPIRPNVFPIFWRCIKANSAPKGTLAPWLCPYVGEQAWPIPGIVARQNGQHIFGQGDARSAAFPSHCCDCILFWPNLRSPTGCTLQFSSSNKHWPRPGWLGKITLARPPQPKLASRVRALQNAAVQPVAGHRQKKTTTAGGLFPFSASLHFWPDLSSCVAESFQQLTAPTPSP